MIIEDIPRLRNNRIRLDEVTEGRVIPPGAVVVQPQASLFSLAGVTVAGGGHAGGESGGPEGSIAYLAGFGGAVDGVGGAIQVVRQQSRLVRREA
jgi:hypothetical protein